MAKEFKNRRKSNKESFNELIERLENTKQEDLKMEDVNKFVNLLSQNSLVILENVLLFLQNKPILLKKYLKIIEKKEKNHAKQEKQNHKNLLKQIKKENEERRLKNYLKSKKEKSEYKKHIKDVYSKIFSQKD